MNAAEPGPKFDLVVIAASAGGLKAVSEVIGALPADFPTPLALVQHRAPTRQEILPRILSRRTSLQVKQAEQDERASPGTLYVAPADWHLTIDRAGRFGFRDGTRIRYLSSSANPLLETAAESLPGRVLAVVLTGSGLDATDGVQAVRKAGGLIIAQDRETSQAFGMPGSAIATGCVDYVLPLSSIGPAIVELNRTGHLASADDLRRAV